MAERNAELLAQQAMRRRGVRTPEFYFARHFDNIQMIKEAVEQRAGVAILPARVMHAELAQGRLAAMPFENASLFRPLGIIHRRRKRFNRLAQAFLELLQAAAARVMVGIE